MNYFAAEDHCLREEVYKAKVPKFAKIQKRYSIRAILLPTTIIGQAC
jgi:hypothetical protein